MLPKFKFSKEQQDGIKEICAQIIKSNNTSAFNKLLNKKMVVEEDKSLVKSRLVYMSWQECITVDLFKSSYQNLRDFIASSLEDEMAIQKAIQRLEEDKKTTKELNEKREKDFGENKVRLYFICKVFVKIILFIY